MQRDASGGLAPLGLGFRPRVRCAMPWANDALLKEDATVQAPCDEVLAQLGR